MACSEIRHTQRQAFGLYSEAAGWLQLGVERVCEEWAGEGEWVQRERERESERARERAREKERERETGRDRERERMLVPE